MEEIIPFCSLSLENLVVVSLAGHCFRAQHGIFGEPEEVPLPTIPWPVACHWQ